MILEEEAMERKPLYELVDEVNDEVSFLNFIKELYLDRIEFTKDNSKDDWQNHTIECFLECAHAWGESSINGLKYYDVPSNPWTRCAQIIYMGKIYE
jgi:hypothetical protein